LPDDKYKYKKVEYIKPSTNGKKDDKPKKILPKRIAQKSVVTKEEPKWIGKPTKKGVEVKKSPLDEALDLLGIKGEYTKSLKKLVEPEEYAKQYKDPKFLKEQIGNLFSWKPIEESIAHVGSVWEKVLNKDLNKVVKRGFDLETNRDLFSAVVTTAFSPISTAFQYIENIPFIGQQSTDYAMRNLNMVGAVVENVVPNVKFSDNPTKQKEWENFFIETVPILVAMTEGKLIKDKISIEKNPEKLLPALEEVIENAQFDKVDGKVKILTGRDAVKKEIKVKKEKVREKKTKANTIEEYKEALSEEKNLINLGETLKLEQLEIKKVEKQKEEKKVEKEEKKVFEDVEFMVDDELI